MPRRPRLLRCCAVLSGLALLALAVSHVTRRPVAKPVEPAPSSSPRAALGTTSASPARASASAAPTEEADRLAAVATGFNDWLLSLRRGNTPSPLAGLQLARDRRAALKQLIALDPRRALALAVPAALRTDLPVEIRAELETPVDAFGRYTLDVTCFGANEQISRRAEIDGRSYQAAVFGRRLATLSKRQLPIHGFAIDDQLAIADTPFRPLDATEVSAISQTEHAVHVAIGSERRTFESAAALTAWGAQAISAEALPDPDANGLVERLPLNWTFGEKSVLWIRAEFADDPGTPASDAQINASMADVDQFYRDVSRGRCSLRTIILPGVLRISRPKAAFANNEASYYQIESEAIALARAYDAANGNSGTYNPDRADRTIVIAKSVDAFGFLGIASVGFKGAFLNGTVASEVVAHELGHNHGLYHSHAWQPTSSSPIGAGLHQGYGDVFDAMGNTARVPAAHFNSKQKDKLLYLAADQVLNANTTGTYRIFRHDHREADGLQAIKIGAGDYEFWLEHRQQVPRPGFPETDRMRRGVQLRWSRYPSSLTGTGTYLLDASPLSSAGMDDAPLVVGQTFTDVNGGLTIKPVASGGTAPREWIDVQVSFGSIDGSNRNPILSASLPFTVVPARTDITFTASAFDPDGDPSPVRWDFGDGRALSIGTQVTHRFATGGPVTVICSAIDGRGGLATKTFNLLVDDPLLAWKTQTGTSPSDSFFTVVHDGRQFLAAGPGSLATSTNGRDWTRRTPIPAVYPWMMAVAGSTYVTVGYTSTAQLNGAIVVSNDGLTWRDVTPSTSLPMLYSIAFGSGRFVAVGRNGALLHSIDGSHWTVVPPLTTQDLRDVHFADGRFLIGGDAGTILTSTDGLTWTNRTVNTAATFTIATSHRGKWIVGNGANLWTSPDAQTWTEVPYDSARSGFQHPLSLGADGLIATVFNDLVFISEDGVTWNSAPLVTPPTMGAFRQAVAFNGTVVLVGNGGRILSTRTRSSVASVPELAATPQSQFVPVGQDVSFNAGTAAVGTTYQWAKNGEPIEGATNASFTLRNAQPSDNGAYTVALANYTGTTTSPVATLVVDANTARIINLSIRSRAGAGSDIFTVGFVVSPALYSGANRNASKQILTRGIGPALAGFGVTGALLDPRIDFFDGTARIGSNDDWGLGTATPATLANTFRTVGAFDLNLGSKDAALLTSFSPKAYTVQLTGANNATGSALAELYDLDTSVMASRLVNVSARAPVGASPDILIGGFVLSGGGQRTVLIRAVGPGLGVFGVTGTLAQPVLTLFNGTEPLASNAGWNSAADPNALRAAALRVGAFALSDGTRDSALLATLPAGAYTIQVSSATNQPGVALLEIYEVP